MRKVPAPIRYILAVLAGTPPAFFLVFNAIFSNGTMSVLERVFTFSVVVVAYGILGVAFGFIWPKPSWRWGIWISISAFIIVGWYSSRETENLPLHFLYLMAASVSACFAALVGTWLSAREQKGR